MRIWHLDFDVNEFENLQWVNLDIKEIQTYDGRPKSEGWIPRQVKRMYDRDFSNAPGLSSHIPVFDRVAVEKLGEYLQGVTEVLPLDCNDGEFFAINVIEVLDCIDYNDSEYKSFSDGSIMRFIKYVFNKEIVSGKHIFKIIDEPLARPFVSDEFKERVEESNLVGFKFELAWQSE